MAAEENSVSAVVEMWTQLRPLVGGGVGSVLLFVAVLIVQWLRMDGANLLRALLTGKRTERADRRSEIEKIRDSLDLRNQRIVTEGDAKLTERDARIDRLEREKTQILREFYHAMANIAMQRAQVDYTMAKASLPPVAWGPLPVIEELPPD